MKNNAANKMISIVIPCYNEEANIRRGVLEDVVRYLDEHPYPWELIVADDGSVDNSLALVEAFAAQRDNVRLLRLAHGGKPGAILGGIQEARGEIILFSDMDLSTPIEELDKLLPWFAEGYDVVIGSRGLVREGFSPFRQFSSWAFRNLRRVLILPKIVDTQCGFKALRAVVAKEIFPRLSFFSSEREIQGWVVSAFDVELLYIAKKWGYRIKEVEVIWRDRDESTTKERAGGKFVSESLEMVREILTVIWNNIMGRYKRPE
ncbi:MAG: glycosyltransferase [Anaerolineaceae bacterium]|jgi:glycosyltransferase involved in cell wall biosynthesis|nr:glycosyltransferase [Anaerolineaceae bacterium]